MLLETRAQHEPFLGAPQRRSAAPAPRGSPAPPARLILSRGHQQMANWCWGLWARCPRHPEPLGGDFQMMLAPSFQWLWLRARCELLCPGCCSSTGSTSSAGRSWERFGDLQESAGTVWGTLHVPVSCWPGILRGTPKPSPKHHFARSALPPAPSAAGWRLWGDPVGRGPRARCWGDAAVWVLTTSSSWVSVCPPASPVGRVTPPPAASRASRPPCCWLGQLAYRITSLRDRGR